ncbi:MAG: hypothetical protein HFACDABA_00434 [Anaerolineales bacterium]|nr:hypothetical protein [Anaerolineales bacterium]
MFFKQPVRTSLSLIILTAIFLSLFFSGSVFPASADEGTPPPDAIVGGAESTAGEWPWQVALIQGGASDYYSNQFCGGSLVAPEWVVTAAHCVVGETTNSIDVVAGIHDLSSHPGAQKRDVIQIISHPSYSGGANDIALLKLSSPVDIGGSGESKTALIPLVPSNVGSLTGVNAWVTGWGNTESNPAWPQKLYEVQVPIISNTLCNDAAHYNGQITSDMLCAGLEQGGKDSCQGDSGGPLVVDTGNGWQLAGVVSWGDGCADPGDYGVYTRVSVFTNWINSYIQSGPASESLTIRSTGTYDGWTLESGESTNIGGSLNASASTLFVGDNASNRQYQSILSFDTSAIPDNATITAVTLKFRYSRIVGGNPFNTHGPLFVDIISGAFGGNNSLQVSDFEATSSLDSAMTVSSATVKSWYSSTLGSGNLGLINLAGVTQFRLHFSADDDNDFRSDYLRFYSGNAPASYRPQLIIEYTVP